MNMSKHVFNLLLIPLILGTLVVACSSDETSESSSPVPEPDPVIEVDNTKPNVVANALVPSNGSTGVLIGTSVKFAFDEPIDVTSVTTADDFTCGATVQLSANNFLSCVPMRSDYDARNDNRSFTVYPVDYLDYNTKYELKIKEWIKDTSGNYLPYDIIPLVFTTVPENTVTFVDKILVDFENKLRLAGGYSLVSELRSVDRKGEGLTITVIDSILKGVRDELTNKSLNNSDDLIKVLESMLTGSIKGLDIAKISDSTRRKEILSDICSELVATIPGREKFYTENKSEIVKSLMNTGVSELSGKVTNEEIPEAIGGILQGFILSLGTLEFSELERVNQVVPDLLKRTIITADTVYSSSGNTFWNTTIEHMSSAMVSGMNQWDDWGGMESKWDDHLSTGLTGIISNLNQIDGTVPSEVEGLIASATSGIWMGLTSLEPNQISTKGDISNSIGQTVLREAQKVSIGGQILNLASVVSGVTAATKEALASQPQNTSELILTNFEIGIDAKNIINSAVTSTSDNINPVISNFSISGGTSAKLSITLIASDENGPISSYYISENSNKPSSNDESWKVYNSSSFLHSIENPTVGSKTFFVWVKDQAGNVSDAKSENIEIIDQNSPTILMLSLANGVAYFNSDTVNVAIDGTDDFGVTGMLLTEFSQSSKPFPNDDRWKDYSTATTYTFTENPFGSKTIYLWLKDASGNVSSQKSDTVTLDLKNPDNVSIEIITTDNSTPKETAEQTVKLLLKAIDSDTNDLGITAYFYSEKFAKPSVNSSDWRNINSTKNLSLNFWHKLSDGTGSKTIYAWFKDLAGNISTVVSDKILNKSVSNPGDPVTFFQENVKYSMLGSKTIFDSIDNNSIKFLEDDGDERIDELFRAIVERIDVDFNDNKSATITSIEHNKIDLEFFAEEYVFYDLDIEGTSSINDPGGLDNLTSSKDNFTPDNTTTYKINFKSASVGDNISITRYISNELILTSKTKINLKDNFEPHVAIQHSNHNGQDSFVNGDGDNASDPNITSKMVVMFDSNVANVASISDKMSDLYYYPKYNLTASLYDKFGFRDLADNSSLATIASSAEDLDNVSYDAVSDQRLKNSEITPLLAVNSPGSSSNAFGKTSTGRSDEFYTTADYNAWATTQTIPAGPTCLYYTADLSTGSFTGSWYPSNSAGTATTGASPISDNDSNQNTIPTTLAGYSISSTHTANLTGGSTVSANILRGPLGCGTLSQTVYGFVRSVKVSLTEPISQITNFSNFASTTGALGQINIPTGELSQNIIGITAVDGKDHMNIQLTDWRTIDASKHFTSDNQTVIANTESGGISKESLMQIVGMSDSDNVSATAGNGRGVVFVDASPPLATSITASDTQSGIRLSITFDQPVQTGRNFRLYGFGGKDNASESSPIYYEFLPNSITGQGIVIRRLSSNGNVVGLMDVFSTADSDNISTASYSESVSGNSLTISILDNITDDFSNFFAALSDNTSTSLSADNNVDPSFYIAYDNITDLNFNSWNNVEYYDAYLTNGVGPTDDRSNQFGPRLVGVDNLHPKIGPADNSSSNDNVFLMEVTDHGLQIISAFGTGADNGTHLMGAGIYFDDNGTTITGDVNNATDNSSTATQNDYPLYRFWNSAGTDAQDNASTNNNTRTRAVITFNSGTVLMDGDSDGRAYIRGYLDNDNTSLTTQTTTTLMRQAVDLGNGATTGSSVDNGSFSVDNKTKLIVGIPDYTFTSDNTTADKTSVGTNDILVIDGIEANGIEYVLHISPPNVTNSDTGVAQTIGSVSGDSLALKVYRKVYLDVSMDGIVADNKTSSTDLANSRELTFDFLENLASATATYTVGSPTNMTGVDFTESAVITNSNQAKITLSNPTGTTDSAGRYVGDGAKISLTATDFSGNSNTYSLTFKLGHDQESPITNINDIGNINPIHNLIESTANSSKKALQAP